MKRRIWLEIIALLLTALLLLSGCGGPELEDSQPESSVSLEPTDELPEFVVEGDTLVTYHGDGWYVTAVVPDGVKHIGDSVFRGMKLSAVILPEGLETIGEYAFADCERLEAVSFPDSLKRIGAYAFDHCTSLCNQSPCRLVLPDHLEVLGDCAFRDCWYVGTLSVPRTIQKVGVDVFKGTYWAEPKCEPDPDASPLEVYPVCNGIYFESVYYGEIIPYGVEKLCDIRCPDQEGILLPPTIRDLEHFNFNDGKIKTIYGIAGSETEALAERYGLIFEPLALEQTSLTLRVGEKYLLALNSGSVSYWKSEDETIASVMTTAENRFYGGTLTALAPGKTTVSAEIYGETFACEVIVTE